MKLMMDLVVNHTSNDHAWFLESRSSKSNPKRDWYIWKPPKSVSAAGVPEPPNNWSQILGEANSAWTYDTETSEYYLSIFTPEQPDLNWENPEVRAAVHDVMHFWLKHGVGGFRMDVINMISKVRTFPDAPKILGEGHQYQPGRNFFINGPRLHEFLKELNQEVLSKYDCVTVGEMPGVSDDNEILETVGANAGELNMIFIFDLVDIDFPKDGVRMALKPWDVKEMKSIVTRWQKVMLERDGWNSVFIENHDNPRSVTRYTDDSDEYRDKGAKLLALMQTTLGGTLFVYQGEEIGIRNAPKDWALDEYNDIETINYWKKCQQMGIEEEGRKIIHMKARDHARTPMHWTADSANAGFCDENTRPWMRVMDDYTTINADFQMKHDAEKSGELSTWQFWQRGLHDRKEHKDVFVYGDFDEISPDDPNVFAYLRTSESGDKWLVILNFSGRTVDWSMPDSLAVDFWACSNYTKGKADKPSQGKVTLKAWEGVLGKCK